MNTRRRPHNRLLDNCRRRRGAIAILACVLLVILLMAAAVSIDLAYMQLTRSQLRAATDAAARAGGEALSRTDDITLARNAAKNAALQNLVGGKALALDDKQIVFGNAAPDRNGRFAFTPGATPFNSVQVLGDRSKESASGEVELFFGRMLGNPSFAPSVASTVVKGDFLERDFAVVVDRSGSMNSSAGKRGSKWKALRAALVGFFKALNDTRDDEKVGLASYSNSSRIDEWLRRKYDGTQSTLKQIKVGGSTNIHAGIMDGRKILNDPGRRRSDANKIMVVMTDGKHNRGPEPVKAAKLAARDGIEIYTITFGKGADVKRMKDVAKTAGGKHYHAPTAEALEKVFLQVVQDSAGIQFIQ